MKRIKNVLRPCAKKIQRAMFKVSTLVLTATGIGKSNRLTAIRNSATKERCFIIGNGPSLTPEVLDMLHDRNEICFGSNRIDRIYSKTMWRPDYICVMDKGFMSYSKNIEPKEYCKNILNSSLKYCFFESGMKHLIKKTGITDSRILYFRNQFRNGIECERKFSEDISVRVEDFATVTSTCIQIAAYMGFKEIVLIGQDMTFSYYIDLDGKIVNENVKDYFENDKQPVKLQGLTNYRGMITGFEEVKKYTDSRGIKVINATPGGRLDVFERKSIEEILEL